MTHYSVITLSHDSPVWM